MKLSLNSNNAWGRASCHTRCGSHPSRKAPQIILLGRGLETLWEVRTKLLAGRWGMLFRACMLYLCPTRYRVSHAILLAFPFLAHFTEKERRLGEVRKGTHAGASGAGLRAPSVARQAELDQAIGTSSSIWSPGAWAAPVWPSWGQEEGSWNPPSLQEDDSASRWIGYLSRVPVGWACHLFFTPVLFKGATWGHGYRTGLVLAESQGLEPWDASSEGLWGSCRPSQASVSPPINGASWL